MKGHRFYAAFYGICERLSGKQMRPLRTFAAGGATGRVLELGCGTGANFEYYDWTSVQAVDATEPDPFMLRKARARAEAAPPAKLRLHEAAAEDLPFDDESFDTAVATLVLCTVARPERALAEVRRVLRPGGSLRVAEHVRGEGTLGSIQDFVQPVYGWFSAGCVLGRATEEYLIAAGFRVEVESRANMGLGMPGLLAVAHRD